jgi:hypothetical protein
MRAVRLELCDAVDGIASRLDEVFRLSEKEKEEGFLLDCADGWVPRGTDACCSCAHLDTASNTPDITAHAHPGNVR